MNGFSAAQVVRVAQDAASVKAQREGQRILDFRFAILDWGEVEQGRTNQSLP